ncbi:MAG: membrane protein insertase YidC [Acidobacteriaceae bacterium]|nr:membrane protein insertase YidC [Acidobacteriaceae bacterium]
MERRVLVAFLLSFLVIYGYQFYFAHPTPKPAPVSATSPGGASGAGTASGQPGAVTASADATPAEPASTPLVGDSTERDIRVETPHVSAVFTNRGARLKSWTLKGYRDRFDKPLELVAKELAATEPLPFTLKTDDARVTRVVNSALYTVGGAPDGGEISSPATITFNYRDDSGISATKEFVLDPASFLVTVRVTLKENDRTLNPAIQWGPGLGDNDSQTGRSAVLPGGLSAVAGTVSRPTAKSIGAAMTAEDTFDYVGIEDHYFLSIALKPGRAKALYTAFTEPIPSDAEQPPRQFVSYELQMPQPEAPITYFVGPKNFDTLAAVDPALTKTINYGMFAVIIVPLLRTLNWIHDYIGNYGWSIVALTALLRIILFPLNHMSVASTRKMQEIQPEAKAIQERYSKLKTTDPARQKMNQELMALYRERGVNPAGGCIPGLLPLPILMAFYYMLNYSIELRGTPFIGWIHDLSQPDKFYLLPILVGVSQFTMQWMMPAPPGVDPAQQKMMMVMPLVMMFLFITMPAGAMLYYFVNNILGIGQQMLTNKLIGPPNIRTARPAAERRVKRVGSGKTEDASREN